MHPFLSSQTTILLAMGVSAYLGLLHLGFVGRRRDPHLWGALWSAAALAFQAARYVQLSTDGAPAQPARVLQAVAPAVVPRDVDEDVAHGGGGGRGKRCRDRVAIGHRKR